MDFDFNNPDLLSSNDVIRQLEPIAISRVNAKMALKEGKKLKSAILRYRTVASENTSVEAKTSWVTDIQPESEEESIDCPDCFDAMIKFCDWDSIRYRCENCDFIMSKIVKDGT
jgi:predicted RNA-binding Zn-ribbon protein involved in translation (DUF1610 family)